MYDFVIADSFFSNQIISSGLAICTELFFIYHVYTIFQVHLWHRKNGLQRLCQAAKPFDDKGFDEYKKAEGVRNRTVIVRWRTN